MRIFGLNGYMETPDIFVESSFEVNRCDFSQCQLSQRSQSPSNDRSKPGRFYCNTAMQIPPKQFDAKKAWCQNWEMN